jgi:ferritin-like metal-binding protein YciE
MKNLHDLFLYELRLIYDGEKQIAKALPNVIQTVSSNSLKTALRDHLKETEEQVRRLDKIFKELGETPSTVTSEVIRTLIKETEKALKSDYDTSVKDAAVINCAQHIEHFEIASYGILKSLAKLFKYDNILELLEATSKEEGKANKKLNEIAEGSVFTEGLNIKARKHVA